MCGAGEAPAPIGEGEDDGADDGSSDLGADGGEEAAAAVGGLPFSYRPRTRCRASPSNRARYPRPPARVSTAQEAAQWEAYARRRLHWPPLADGCKPAAPVPPSPPPSPPSAARAACASLRGCSGSGALERYYDGVHVDAAGKRARAVDFELPPLLQVAKASKTCDGGGVERAPESPSARPLQALHRGYAPEPMMSGAGADVDAWWEALLQPSSQLRTLTPLEAVSIILGGASEASDSEESDAESQADGDAERAAAGDGALLARLSYRLSLLQIAYAACTDAVDSPSFRATVLRWLDEEELHDNDGKSLLATGHGDCDSTLLHWAAMKGDLVVVEALLRHGADRQQRSNGMTPADVAREYGQAHLMEREGRGLLYGDASEGHRSAAPTEPHAQSCACCRPVGLRPPPCACAVLATRQPRRG